MSRIEFTPAWPRLRHTAVIAFGHRARHGKDEAARVLEAAAPGRVRRFAFSDGIAQLCRIKYGMTTRDGPLLQRVGYEERTTNPGVWLRVVAWAIADWDADARQPQCAVIAGMRFADETHMVTALGGHCVRIRRFDADGRPFVAQDRDPHHPTETALDDFAWPHTIDNDEGDLLGLTLNVQALAHRLVPSVFR